MSEVTMENRNQMEANLREDNSLDVAKLAEELGTVSLKILEKGASPENIATAGVVSNAQLAAQKKDADSVLQLLAGAGEVALETAYLIGAYEAAEALRRSGISTDLERARIQPWAQLPYREVLIEEEKLADLTQDKILGSLERFGICLIRPIAQSATKELVESVIEMIGTPTEIQNEARGPIKDIRPKPGVDPNTGDSKGDLGFHVDGTQTVS